jgi:hypothetical protein
MFANLENLIRPDKKSSNGEPSEKHEKNLYVEKKEMKHSPLNSGKTQFTNMKKMFTRKPKHNSNQEASREIITKKL